MEGTSFSTGPCVRVCVSVFFCCFSSRYNITVTQPVKQRDDDDDNDDVQRHSISNNVTFQESSGHICFNREQRKKKRQHANKKKKHSSLVPQSRCVCATEEHWWSAPLLPPTSSDQGVKKGWEKNNMNKVDREVLKAGCHPSLKVFGAIVTVWSASCGKGSNTRKKTRVEMYVVVTCVKDEVVSGE